MDRRLLLAFVAGIGALIASRASRHPAPRAPSRAPTSSIDPAPAPRVRTSWATPTPTPPAAEAPVVAADASAAPAAPLTGIDGLLAQMKKAHKVVEEAWEKYPEAVWVKHANGATGVYRLEDWAPDSDQIYARKFLDGRFLWYAGPDAGPPSDPAAFVPFRDLIPPDGWFTFPSGRRVQFLRSLDPSIHIQLVDTPDADPP